jgi:phosphoserine/homoserine phosphotransferase
LEIVCLDLEGVLVPEIWIELADHTGIDELRATTRDVTDYDELMRFRLAVLEREGLGMAAIEQVVAGMAPLEGAASFLASVRERYQVIILSDTFYEFARPLMRQLGWPTLFCHGLSIAHDGRIVDYRLRLSDHKRKSVAALRELNFRTVAAGDSYNDTTMLAEADGGILFRPPEAVVNDFPEFTVATDHAALRDGIDAVLGA